MHKLILMMWHLNCKQLLTVTWTSSYF